MCPIPIKILKQNAVPNLSLHNFDIYTLIDLHRFAYQKGAEKIVKDKLCRYVPR